MGGKSRVRQLVLCVGLILTAFFLGCAGLQPGGGGGSGDYEQRLQELEDQVLMLQAAGVGAAFRPYTCISGGTSGCLDKTDGAGLGDGDAGVVVVENHGTFGDATLTYALDATSSCGGDAADGYSYIQPDNNPGTKCWELTQVVANGGSFAGNVVIDDNSGNSPFLIFIDGNGEQTTMIQIDGNFIINPDDTGTVSFNDESISNVDDIAVATISADGSTIDVTDLIGFSGGSGSLTPVTDDCDNFAANFTGANLYGGTFICDLAGTCQLPVMVAGMNFTVVTAGAIECIVDTNIADGYLMDGTTGVEGANLTNTSTAGDIAVIQYYDASDWLITTNGWTPE